MINLKGIAEKINKKELPFHKDEAVSDIFVLYLYREFGKALDDDIHLYKSKVAIGDAFISLVSWADFHGGLDLVIPYWEREVEYSTYRLKKDLPALFIDMFGQAKILQSYAHSREITADTIVDCCVAGQIAVILRRIQEWFEIKGESLEDTIKDCLQYW